MQNAFVGIPAFASFSAPSWQSRQEIPRTVCASWLNGRGWGAADGKIACMSEQEETATASMAMRQSGTITIPGWRQDTQRTRGSERMTEPEFQHVEPV